MKNYHSLKYLIQLLLLILASLGTNAAYAAQHCSDNYSIDQTFANGARWDMCWTHDDNHGIRYHHVYYTPKGGTRRMVLVDAAISQIHVPYDDNGARYHDVSDYGLGGRYMPGMSNAECPSGKLHRYGTKNVVCTQVKKQTNAYRFGSTAASQDVLKVFSISSVGAYIYIPQWLFFDDGSMEPTVTATGSLERYTRSDQHGWLLDQGKIGLSHIHNYFWRLDFDLGGTAKDDIVQEINYSVSSGKRVRSVTPFTSEVARSVSPTQQRSWMVSDRVLKNSKYHAMGYELKIGSAGHREIGPAYESFTANDFYVTKAKSCEQIASHNRRINICSTDSLDKFANGESLTNQDLIVWVGLSFYHMPRAEDYPRMDVHSNSFKITPRDWHAKNPLKTLVVSGKNDTASSVSGTLVAIDSLANDVGDGIALHSVENPANGSAVISNGKINYTSNAGFVGTERFNYNIISPSGIVYPAQIAVTVTAPVVATPLPVASSDALTIQKNTTVVIDVLANDTGSVLVLQPISAVTSSGGAVSLSSNQIKYTPKQDYVGTDTFSYTFKDSEGRSAGSQVTITIEGDIAPPNAQPVVTNQSIQLSANQRANVVLTATDADGDTLTYQVIRLPQHGSLLGTAPNFVYQPEANYAGPDSFTFIASDSLVDSNVATVSFTVNAELSDAMSNVLSSQLTLDGNASDWVAVNRFPADPDDITEGQINWRSLAMAHDATNVHLLYENHGNVRATSVSGSYIPWGWQVYMDTDKNNQTGFKVGDIGADYILEGPALHRYMGQGSNWNWETVDVAQSQYNGPAAELRFPRSKIGNPNAMYLLIQGNNAAVGGTEVDYYPDTQNDSNSSNRYFHYQFESAVNSGLIANSQSLTTSIDTPINIVLTTNTLSPPTTSYRIITRPQHGSLTGNGLNLVYTPSAGYTGADSFSFVANDGSQDSPAATIVLKVNPLSSLGVNNNVATIQIDGDSSEWNNLQAFNSDPDDMALPTETIDWQSATMAHSDTKLYVLYRNHGAINQNALTNDYIPWGWQTYMDTDNDVNTGFKVGDIGADFLLEATQVGSYTGDGASWSWNTLDAVDLLYKNDLAEMSFSLNTIGNPESMRVAFKGNNLSVGGSEVDLYPDNAETSGAAGNYFTYSLESTLQSISQRPSASNQTVDVTAAQANQITLSASSARGESISYHLITPPQNGVLDTLGPVVNYTPNAGFVGADSFEYVLNNGVYDSSLARVNLMVSDAEASVTPNETDGSGDGGGGSLGILLQGLIFILLLLNQLSVRAILTRLVILLCSINYLAN